MDPDFLLFLQLTGGLIGVGASVVGTVLLSDYIKKKRRKKKGETFERLYQQKTIGEIILDLYETNKTHWKMGRDDDSEYLELKNPPLPESRIIARTSRSTETIDMIYKKTPIFQLNTWGTVEIKGESLQTTIEEKNEYRGLISYLKELHLQLEKDKTYDQESRKRKKDEKIQAELETIFESSDPLALLHGSRLFDVFWTEDEHFLTLRIHIRYQKNRYALFQYEKETQNGRMSAGRDSDVFSNMGYKLKEHLTALCEKKQSAPTVFLNSFEEKYQKIKEERESLQKKAKWLSEESHFYLKETLSRDLYPLLDLHMHAERTKETEKKLEEALLPIQKKLQKIKEEVRQKQEMDLTIQKAIIEKR